MEASFNSIAEMITGNVLSVLEDSMGYENFSDQERKDKTKEVVNNMIRNLKGLVKMKLRDREVKDGKSREE